MQISAASPSFTILAAVRGPRFDVVGGVPYFRNPPKGPPSVTERRYFSKPAILRPEMGGIATGAGRVSGLLRLAAHSNPDAESFRGVVTSDILTWHRLTEHNENPRRLPMVREYNPTGEGKIHPLPPRDLTAAMADARKRSRSDEQWSAAYQWARERLKDPRWADMSSDLQASAQFQVMATSVGALATVVDHKFVERLVPGVPYTFLHACKSLDAAGQVGAEILRNALTVHNRPDLATRVVSSEGYWTEVELWGGEPVEVRLTGENEQAVQLVKLELAGSTGRNRYADVDTAIGWAEVMRGQMGGVLKNVIANATGFKAVSIVLDTDGAPDLLWMHERYEGYRRGVIQAAEQLVDGQFSRQVANDILRCTHVDWAELWNKVERFGVLNYRPRDTRLAADELIAVRASMQEFYRTADVKKFGTTNNTFAMVAGLAFFMKRGGLINDFSDIITPAEMKIPEGVRAMPALALRYKGRSLPPPFVSLIKRYQPILTMLS